MTKENYKGIWIFAEQRNGTLNPVTLELLAKAQELKAHNGENITAVLLGSNVASLASTLITHGADQVIVAEHENLAAYSARPYQQALTQLAEKYNPSIIIYGATTLGRDLAPRMMVSLKTGLTADAIDLGYDEDGVFYQTTPAYGGKILAHIVILEKRPQMATVRPMMFTPLEADPSRAGNVITESVVVDREDSYGVISTEKKDSSGVAIDQAALLVSGGRGIKSEADFGMLDELAQLLGGQVAASRPPGCRMSSRSVSPAPPSSQTTLSTSASLAPCSTRSVCKTAAASSASTTTQTRLSLPSPIMALSATTDLSFLQS